MRLSLSEVICAGLSSVQPMFDAVVVNRSSVAMICFFMLFVVFRLLDYGNRPCLCQTVRTSSARRDGVVLCDTDVGRDPQADVEVAVGILTNFT